MPIRLTILTILAKYINEIFMFVVADVYLFITSWRVIHPSVSLRKSYIFISWNTMKKSYDLIELCFICEIFILQVHLSPRCSQHCKNFTDYHRSISGAKSLGQCGDIAYLKLQWGDITCDEIVLRRLHWFLSMTYNSYLFCLVCTRHHCYHWKMTWRRSMIALFLISGFLRCQLD